MRRLPVYFLIDVSESMVGEPIAQVEEGLGTIITELKRDPYALETVYISIVVFAGKARTIVPLTDVVSFYPPRLPIGGGTSIGQGLYHLMREMKAHLRRTTPHEKGDWRPLIFLFTDGAPTDNFRLAVADWQENWKEKAQMVAVCFGPHANTEVLHQLTDQVLVFHQTDANSYRQFFKWITASIQATSQSVNMGASDQLDLAASDPNLLEKVPGAANSGPTMVDTNVATFLARCTNTKKHYLMKYNRQQQPAELGGLSYTSSVYRLAGSFPLGDDFFSLSESAVSTDVSVSTADLQGFPHCPCCGNTVGFSKCTCGNLFCSTVEATEATCPWCDRKLRFRQSDAGDSDFNVSRTQG
jgi:uncharacterized protein YegL